MKEDPGCFDGSEPDWLAVDDAGHVVCFAVAGHGSVRAAVRSLPATSSIGLVASFPLGERTDWLQMARRGIYAFDGSYDGYHLKRRPSA